ncbi:MAG: hypothetical protein JW915_24510 [Chitinispirillaceae bacterium]|nr:hypothetical protein [Chitinispirillaceae bacterium]
MIKKYEDIHGRIDRKTGILFIMPITIITPITVQTMVLQHATDIIILKGLLRTTAVLFYHHKEVVMKTATITIS